MNPNAPAFTFNPGASSWVPASARAAAPAAPAPEPVKEEKAPEPAPAAVNADVASVTDSMANVSITASAGDEVQDDEDAIDENDPLWIATLKVSKGDRAAALKMLEDPDELMKHAEIRAVMESDAAAEEEDASWEAQAAAAEAAPQTATAPEPKSEPKKTSSESPAPASRSYAVDDDEPMEEEGEEIEGDPREHLNLVFIGHVDAGKSTLSGSILYLTGQVDARTIERFEKEAKQRNRDSWFLAFIMDTSEEERAKGKTVEVGRAHFETADRRFTILDAPGHKNYVPNMISGAVQADVGLLVISARRGEFETGFEKGGQTREHALLAKTLGIRFLVVVINKMDDTTVEWSKERYEECVNKLKPFLKSCGYAIKRDVRFLPISGLTGANILNEVEPSVCPWWRELHTSGAHNTSTPTLIQTLDGLHISGRDAEAPLRVPVLDRYFERGCVVMGKVESGTLRVGDEVVVCPTKKKARVDAIYVWDVKVKSARPGENVSIKFNLNVEDVQKGYVLSAPTNLCPAVTEFKVQLLLVDVVEHRPIFSPGYDCVMHIHTSEVEVTCVHLHSVMDKRGQPIRKPFALQGQTCIARFVTPLSVCLENFDVMPALGRVTLRDEGKTIAIGKIIELVKVVN